MIFDPDDKSVIALFQNQIKAPYTYTQISTLGGKDRASVIIKISLDPKNSWSNSIFENSRYFMIHLSRNGEMEMFHRYYKLGKMRKTKVTSLKQAIEKINKYIESQS
jgi:hypothetical protein